MPTHLESLRLGVPPAEAKAICVFIHGRTQSPEDMQDQVVGRLTAEGVAFVLPRASANSWYDARAVDPLSEATRRQLDLSLDHIRTVVGELSNEAPAETPLLVGGFSQGACLSLEYAMKYGPWHGAMVNLTGCRVGTADCERPFADLDRMPVYLTGSDRDPWIPVDAMAMATEALARARATLRCDIFPDRGHEPSESEVALVDRMLKDLADGRLPFRQA